MPTYERTRRFERDWKALSAEDRGRFAAAFHRFNEDLSRRAFRAGLRVKRVEGTEGIFELIWAPNGRATFQYGESRGKGAHVILRRIGMHEVFRRP